MLPAISHTHQTLARLAPIDPLLAAAELHMGQLLVPARLLRIALRAAHVALAGRPAPVRRAVARPRLARHHAVPTGAHAARLIGRIELRTVRHQAILVAALALAQRLRVGALALKVAGRVAALRRRLARVRPLAALVDVDARCAGRGARKARPTGAIVAVQLVLAALVGGARVPPGGALVQVLLARGADKEARTRADAGRHAAAAVHAGLRADGCGLMGWRAGYKSDL